MIRRFFSVVCFSLAVWCGNAQAQTAVDSAEFHNCFKENQLNQSKLERCYTLEAQRYMKKIEEFYYNVLPKVERFKPLAKDGTPEDYFKKMLNTWKLYIKSYCDISAIANNEYTGDPLALTRANCLYDMTKQQLNQIGEIPYTYYSNMAN